MPVRYFMKFLRDNFFNILGVLIIPAIGAYVSVRLANASQEKDISVINNNTIPALEYKILIEQKQREDAIINLTTQLKESKQDIKDSMSEIRSTLLRIENKVDNKQDKYRN